MFIYPNKNLSDILTFEQFKSLFHKDHIDIQLITINKFEYIRITNNKYGQHNDSVIIGTYKRQVICGKIHYTNVVTTTTPSNMVISNCIPSKLNQLLEFLYKSPQLRDLMLCGLVRVVTYKDFTISKVYKLNKFDDINQHVIELDMQINKRFIHVEKNPNYYLITPKQTYVPIRKYIFEYTGIFRAYLNQQLTKSMLNNPQCRRLLPIIIYTNIMFLNVTSLTRLIKAEIRNNKRNNSYDVLLQQYGSMCNIEKLIFGYFKNNRVIDFSTEEDPKYQFFKEHIYPRLKIDLSSIPHNK